MQIDDNWVYTWQSTGPLLHHMTAKLPMISKVWEFKFWRDFKDFLEVPETSTSLMRFQGFSVWVVERWLIIILHIIQSAINFAQTSLPLPSPPLFRRNVSKWQCRRLLVLLFCFTKSAGNVWPRKQCQKTPIQQRITDDQMTLPASERAIAKHARQMSRAGDRVYVVG